MSEKPVVISCEGASLIGIINCPEKSLNVGVIVIVAGGPQYRVGAHRPTAVIARTRIAYGSVLTGYFGLLTLLMLWNTVIAPSQRFPIALTLIVSVLPLMLPLRGLLHGRPVACTWAAYLSLFYVVHGIVEAAAAPGVRFLAETVCPP